MEEGRIQGYSFICFRTRASRLASDLREYDLRGLLPGWAGRESGNAGGEGAGSADTGNPGAVNTSVRKVRPGEILVTYGNLHRGFEYPLLKFVFITEGDMFGVEKKESAVKRQTTRARPYRVSQSCPWGIMWSMRSTAWVYKGIEKVERDKVIKDYIKIEYGDGGNLYLPATRLKASRNTLEQRPET